MGNQGFKRRRVADDIQSPPLLPSLPPVSLVGFSGPGLSDVIWGLILFEWLSITERACLLGVSRGMRPLLERSRKHAQTLRITARESNFKWPLMLTPASVRRAILTVFVKTNVDRVDDVLQTTRASLESLTIQEVGFLPCRLLHQRLRVYFHTWPRLETLRVCVDRDLRPGDYWKELGAPRLRKLELLQLSRPMYDTYLTTMLECIGTDWHLLEYLDISVVLWASEWRLLAKHAPRLLTLLVRAEQNEVQHEGSRSVSDETVRIWLDSWPNMRRFQYRTRARWEVSPATLTTLLAWASPHLHIEADVGNDDTSILVTNCNSPPTHPIVVNMTF
jgi:hypothetical protein